MKQLRIRLAITITLLCLFGTGLAETAEDDKSLLEPPTSFSVAHGAHKDAKAYVDAKEAGYERLAAMAAPIQSEHFQLLAQKKPVAPVSGVTIAKQWDAFLKEYAGIDIGTGKQLTYTPDFTREQVLALFAGPELRGDDYMDIEVYAENATLKGFVFHGYAVEGKDPIAISEAAGQPFRGTFYLATVPKQFVHKAIEFRMGYQSWGRVCSRFSPPIKNSPPRKQAEEPSHEENHEQDAASEPSPGREVKAIRPGGRIPLLSTEYQHPLLQSLVLEAPWQETKDVIVTGNRVILAGTIGDFATNKPVKGPLTGPVAIYHRAEAPHTV